MSFGLHSMPPHDDGEWSGVWSLESGTLGLWSLDDESTSVVTACGTHSLSGGTSEEPSATGRARVRTM